MNLADDFSPLWNHRWGDGKILVVGDVMLDKYYYTNVQRISPEAPVPIATIIGERKTLGGAANVAHNLSLLGAPVSMVGVIGNDYHGEQLKHKFFACSIDIDGIVSTNNPTITKVRILGGHQQMLRLDFEKNQFEDKTLATNLLNSIMHELEDDIRAIIISDYGKGVCSDKVCTTVIAEGKKRHIPVVIDPKGKEWSRYQGANYITPNLKELNEVQAVSVGNTDDAVERAARFVMQEFQIDAVLATRSEAGLSLVSNDECVHIPTKAQEVFDVSGAGDTVAAVFTWALACGLQPAAGAYLANLAASVAVAKLGTYAVSLDELRCVVMQDI